MRRWGIDPQASTPADQPPLSQQPPPSQSAQQQNFVPSAAAPAFAPPHHVDAIELQLKEFRLQQQQHQQQQKKPPKQRQLLRNADDAESVPHSISTGGSDAASSVKMGSRSKPQRPLKPAIAVPSAASTGVTAGVEAPLPASTASTDFTRAPTKAIQSARDKQPKHSSSQAPSTKATWAVGAPCLAKYAADGKFYPAQVVEVSGSGITVTFTEYESEFQTCVATDLKAIAGKNGARGQVAEVITTPTSPLTQSVVHQPAALAKKQAEQKQAERPALSARTQVQPKQHVKNEASLKEASELTKKPPQEPPIVRPGSQDTKPAPVPASIQPVQQPSQKNKKKQMPEHAQEWETASFAVKSNQLAADLHFGGVALSSVGLVTTAVGSSVKAATPQASAQAKLPSAFDLAKMRADAKAAEQLQQVPFSFARHFRLAVSTSTFFADSCSKIVEQACGCCCCC